MCRVATENEDPDAQKTDENEQRYKQVVVEVRTHRPSQENFEEYGMFVREVVCMGTENENKDPDEKTGRTSKNTGRAEDS